METNNDVGCFRANMINQWKIIFKSWLDLCTCNSSCEFIITQWKKCTVVVYRSCMLQRLNECSSPTHEFPSFVSEAFAEPTFFSKFLAMWPPIFPSPMKPISAAGELDIFLINTALIFDLPVSEQIDRCKIGIDTHFRAILMRYV